MHAGCDDEGEISGRREEHGRAKSREHCLRCPRASCCRWLSDMKGRHGVADATKARTLEHVSKAFSDVEKHDMMVGKVLMSPEAYADAMERGHGCDGVLRRLWGAEVVLLYRELICWDEEPG